MPPAAGEGDDGRTAGGGFAGVLRPRPGRPPLPHRLRAPQVGVFARTLRDGLADPGLRRLLSEIDDDAPIHPANAVHLFADGAAAAEAMLQAIGRARREVLVETYIFQDDDAGHRFRRALAAAAGRGVTVRVLADAFGSLGTRGRFWRPLREAGAEVRLFHPLLRTRWFQPWRDHRKILVADRRLAFTGGMNIADAYARPLGSEGAWRDTHLAAAGPAALEMTAVFAEGWERAGGAPLERWEDGGGEATAPATDGAPVTAGAEILVLDARPGRGYAETAAVLTAILAGARRRVWITNAYFAPTRLARRVLVAAARFGCDVRLLLPGRTDVPPVRWAAHGFYAELLAAGIRIFEYQPAVLHAKAMVADDHVAVVGSSNLDVRSFRFNSECNLVIFDAAVTAALERQFHCDVAQAVEITAEAWARRPWWRRLFHRAARRLAPLL